MSDVTIYVAISSKAPKMKHGKYYYLLAHKRKTLRGGGEWTEGVITGHRLLLVCLIEAMKHMTKPATITVRTDCMYLVNGHANYAEYERNGWMKPGKKNEEVKNADLWQQLHELEASHAMRYQFDPIVSIMLKED